MKKMQTAERVSTEASDNYVFQRSLLAYRHAAAMVHGDVLEIGTGTGYGIQLLAPHARRFITVDKSMPRSVRQNARTDFYLMEVPPIGFESGSFDCVVCFQVIEHIAGDIEFVREVVRVLRPGGRFIVTTPNAPMSLTRNPWHVREYYVEVLQALLGSCFERVESFGITGNERVQAYYLRNRESVQRLTRWDIFDLQHRLPRRLLQLPYDWLNRRNRRKLLLEEPDATAAIRMDDYQLEPYREECFDLFIVAEKGPEREQ